MSAPGEELVSRIEAALEQVKADIEDAGPQQSRLEECRTQLTQALLSAKRAAGLRTEPSVRGMP